VLYYQKIAQPTDVIASLVNENESFYLATVHRAENTDDPVRLNHIMNALETISQKTPVVFPLHPRTRKLLQKNTLSHVQVFIWSGKCWQENSENINKHVLMNILLINHYAGSNKYTMITWH